MSNKKITLSVARQILGKTAQRLSDEEIDNLVNSLEILAESCIPLITERPSKTKQLS